MKLQAPGAKTDTNYFCFSSFTDKTLQRKGRRRRNLPLGFGVRDEVGWVVRATTG